MKMFIVFIVTATITNGLLGQDSIPLYPGGVPNSKPSDLAERHVRDQNGILRISQVTQPTITVYRPKGNNSGAAVVICPGGGYSILAASHEGKDIAESLNAWGVTGIVLKYRLPNEATMENKSIGPLQDAQRAIQLVKERAKEWDIDTSKVGIMGFSAGGHLASTAGTHFNKAFIGNTKNISLRPAFMILGYPVISFQDSVMHRGSRENLIGKNASRQDVDYFSNELQVTRETPPTFLVHAGDDRAVPVQNSLYFYDRLAKNGVPSELHVYPKGGHGFGMHNRTTEDKWMDRLHSWMKGNGWAE